MCVNNMVDKLLKVTYWKKVNPLPNDNRIERVSCRRLKKYLWENQKLLNLSNYSFPTIIYILQKQWIFILFYYLNGRLKPISIWDSTNCVVWSMVKGDTIRTLWSIFLLFYKASCRNNQVMLVNVNVITWEHIWKRYHTGITLESKTSLNLTIQPTVLNRISIGFAYCWIFMPKVIFPSSQSRRVSKSRLRRKLGTNRN